MKYLTSFLKICKKHSDNDCNGCPFSTSNTKSLDCHKWIIQNPDKAKEMIYNYALAHKMNKYSNQNVSVSLRGQEVLTINGMELERECCHCHDVVTMNIEDVVWDGYIYKNVWVCPKCSAENNLV